MLFLVIIKVIDQFLKFPFQLVLLHNKDNNNCLQYKLLQLFMKANPISFSTDDYVVPEWSSMPKYAYHLQIIKEGIIIGNINLKKKQFILVGRNSEICDLFIDNPSISRKHAIVQYKSGQQNPYIYDLGGTHGTQVNRQKLPPRAFQKLKPFDMIKFGLSSRYYILRCPQLQYQQKVNQEQNENKFEQLLAERKKQLSKQQMKQKYIQMLENDPYFKANNVIRKMQGEEAAKSFNGVSWGISDQYEVYAYRNQNQFQLEPDVIRRLPGLDQIQLNKISEFEGNLRLYEQIQSQLNQLAAKQRREYGLQQKLRQKKQKLQKKFLEAVQVLQKSQDWIRVNLFGQKQNKVVKKQRAKRGDDSFEDDQFLDRTLKKKPDKSYKQNQEGNQDKEEKKDMFTTADFWKLQKQLRGQLKILISLQNQKMELCKVSQDLENQQDDLDAYMKQNNDNLEQQEKQLNNERIQGYIKKIEALKQYLIPLIGESEVKKIQDEQRGVKYKIKLTEQEKTAKKDMENKKRISDVLDRLDIIKQAEQQQIDDQDVKIFEYYKNKVHQQSQQEQQQNAKRLRSQLLDVQQHNYEPKNKKVGHGQYWGRDQVQYNQKGEPIQQQYQDLTKLK